MTQNVVSLHRKPREIGHYVHLGHGAHRVLSNLFVNGGLPIKRAVVDAAHAIEQRELLVALKSHGVQLVLDTRSMELGTPGGATRSRRQLPWAPAEGHWTPSAFGQKAVLVDACKQIAEFSVSQGVDVVLAPTHFYERGLDEWFDVDIRACIALRDALNSQGGQSIAIDVPITAMSAVLENSGLRQRIIHEVGRLPIDNVWVRASGFGIKASAAKTHKMIGALSDLASSGKPIVLDSAGGLSALTVAAFGVAGAIAHGIANQNEQFNSYPLRKPQEKSGGGGGKWIYLPTIDKYVKASKLDSLFELRGVRPLLICTDTQCCPHGASSMKGHEKRHALKQRVRQLKELEASPEHQRVDHLLRRDILPAGSTCRSLERLPSIAEVPEFKKMAREQSHHIDNMEQMIRKLALNRSQLNRSRESVAHISQVVPIASGY